MIGLRRPGRRWVRRVLYGGLVGHLALGVVHLSLSNVHSSGDPLRTLFEFATVIGVPVAMLVVVRTIDRFGLTGDDYWRIVKWGVASTGGVLLLAGLYLLDLRFEGVALDHPSFPLLLAADVGAAFGVLIGWQEVRVRRGARRAEAAEIRAELSEHHKRTFVFLNRILRHHVLNGMSVVLGYAEELKRDAREDQIEALDAILERGDRVVTNVANVRGIVETLSGETPVKQVDLSAVLRREIETARRTHPEATFESDVPPDVFAVGTDVLDVVFENLLDNAVEHNDAEVPRVRVEVSPGGPTVGVTVSDNGPGIPDDVKSAYFERGKHGEGSLGEGLGLYLAETVVTHCGGRIRIEDEEPTGTRVRIELPTSRERIDAGEVEAPS